MGSTPTSIVILGGGTGGTLTANRLRRIFPTSDLTITVVDQIQQSSGSDLSTKKYSLLVVAKS